MLVEGLLALKLVVWDEMAAVGNYRDGFLERRKITRTVENFERLPFLGRKFRMLGEQGGREVQQSFPFCHRDFSSLQPLVAAGKLAIACATSGNHNRGISLAGLDRPRLKLFFRLH